jgi:hypothetical protein
MCHHPAKLREFPEEHAERIEELIHDTFLQGDNCVVGDVNAFGAYLRATLRDVAQPDAVLLP